MGSVKVDPIIGSTLEGDHILEAYGTQADRIPEHDSTLTAPFRKSSGFRCMKHGSASTVRLGLLCVGSVGCDTGKVDGAKKAREFSMRLCS